MADRLRSLRRGAFGDAAIGLGLAAAAVALHLVYFDRGFVLLDEGYVATIAQLVKRGGAPYRDAVTYVLPGSYELLAAAFRLAGESLLVARILTLCLTGVAIGLLYRLARAAMLRSAAAAAAGLCIVLSVWSYPQWHVYGYQQAGLVALLGAAALLAPPGAAARQKRAFLAGIVAGLAVCMKQTYAASGLILAAFAVLDAGVCRERPEDGPVAAAGGRPLRRALGTAAAFGLGCAIPVGLTLGWLAARGTLGDFAIQAVLSPLHGAAHQGYLGLPPLLPLYGQDARLRETLVYYLPPVIQELRLLALLGSPLYRETVLVDLGIKALFWMPVAVLVAGLLAVGVAAARGARARGVQAGSHDGGGRERVRIGRAWPTVRDAVFLLSVDLALLTGINRPLDWMHVSMAYPGTILVGAWLVAGGERPSRTGRAALVAVLAVALVPAVVLAIDVRRTNIVPLDAARAGVLVRPAEARTLGAVIAAVRDATRPGEPILVVPYHPLVYFLTERPAASRFLLVWPVEYQTGRDREMLEAVDRLGVGTVVHGVVSAPQLGPLSANAPELLAGLVDRFRVAELFGEERWGIAFQRLERRPPLPGGTVNLDGLLDRAAAVRETDGRGEPVEARDLAREVIWPFERVLAVDLTPGGVSELRLPLPAGARGDLILSYGVNPDRWVAYQATAVEFEALLEQDGARVSLFRTSRDPQTRVADRPWPERRFRLDGRATGLVLRVAAPPGSTPAADLAGWVTPRIEPPRDAPRPDG